MFKGVGKKGRTLICSFTGGHLLLRRRAARAAHEWGGGPRPAAEVTAKHLQEPDPTGCQK